MQKIRIIRLVLIGVGLIGALMGLLCARSNSAFAAVSMAIAFACIFGHLIYTLVAWRCPHCGRLLPVKGGFWNKFCLYCGKELD